MEIINKKVAGIILAAGSGSRMGCLKQLLPFKGRSILEHVIGHARKSHLSEIILVLGHGANLIQQTIDPACYLNPGPVVKIIVNREYNKGQSSSVKKGLENISEDCDGAMFILGDQPLVTHSIIDLLVSAFESTGLSMVIPYCDGKRGNPVIIGKSLFFRIRALTGDTGPRVLFKEFKDEILAASVKDNAVLKDIDTYDDYNELIAR